MRAEVRAFRNAAAQVCQLRRFPFREFMEQRGLEDILAEAESSAWSAQEVACQVLARCCVEGGKFNNFQIGLLSVMTFLNERFGPLGQGGEQAFRDLVQVLNNPGTPETIRQWLSTHYP